MSAILFIEIPVTQSEHDYLLRRAQRHGVTVTDFVRSVLFEVYANGGLADALDQLRRDLVQWQRERPASQGAGVGPAGER